MSAKYPRSFHLPWSPGGTNDDKRLDDVTGLLGVDLVITEKCDGSNLTYTRTNVYSRSHSGPPAHPSFDLAKATHGRVGPLLSPGISVFCEYCYAVHSIAYAALPDYSLVFGVRDDEQGVWWSWDMTVALAEDVGLKVVPVLFRGFIPTAKELEAITTELTRAPSAFGGPREGVVVRRADEFRDADFPRSLAKWVRSGHVQTDDHWAHQAIRVQPLGQRTRT